MATKSKWVILDRDGVINVESNEYIKSLDEWIPIPGSLEALGRLTQAGFRIAIATNQSGIARGLFDEAMLNAIHQKMQNAVATHGGYIDAIFYCPHLPEENCDCRKPETGLLLQIAEQFQCDLTQLPFIGDSWRDMQAAMAVGAQPILVKTGNGETTLRQHPEAHSLLVFDDLWHAADYLLTATSCS